MQQKKHLDGRGKGEFLYDYKYDTLTFKVKDRNYKKSVEFLNFVVDFDKDDFITGVRIFDASEVFDVDGYLLNNIVHFEFNASVDNNILTLTFKFVGKRRNKIIPILTQSENFTQQITAPILGNKHMADSSVACIMEA